ncbi:hypothetical protein [Klebsiella michiganensis]|uniref:hypothetical protein n=1 Tax=Klebsiella michiganensis TaxID=1134687 RepID=UPI001899E14C|nr:hypothetical protein [Klebsiella michiganensis]UKS49803.1 hypothetical protein L3249_09650 [Klebsiella michiganensis]
MIFEAKAWGVPFVSARNPEDRAKDEDLIVMAIRHILNDKAGADQTGFKNARYIAAIFVSDTNPGGYREDRGYNGFSGTLHPRCPGTGQR